MNIHQCERKACDDMVSGDDAKFMLYANGKMTPCQWLDPYMGLLRVADAAGFCTTSDVDDLVPNAECTPLWEQK